MSFEGRAYFVCRKQTCTWMGGWRKATSNRACPHCGGLTTPISKPDDRRVRGVTADDRKEAMAKAIEAKPHWWQNQYMNALERIETPGELEELADGEYASIEPAFHDLVNVYVAHHEEGIDFTPDECRRLAFELLVLADLAETAPASTPQPADQQEGEHRG